MWKKAAKVTGYTMLGLFWVGFVLPYLVSSSDDVLVTVGVAATVFTVVAAIFYICKRVWEWIR